MAQPNRKAPSLGVGAPRILVADDDLVSRTMLVRTLERLGYRVESAADGQAALVALAREGAPSLAILDWMMPHLSGLEVCEKVRALGRETHIYLMLLTGRQQPGDLITGMDAGADDYLTKPFNADELRVRLRAAERIVTLQQQLMVAKAELGRQATRDPLTDLLNRRAARAAEQVEISRCARMQRSLAFVVVDIDHFKLVNDTHGHLAGDDVLKAVARRLTAGVREYDTVAREGGEEFLLILPDCDPLAAQRVAERLRASIAETPIATGAGSLQLTASFGVACAVPPCDAERLKDSADRALYRAKRAGRNRVEVAPQLVEQCEPRRRGTGARPRIQLDRQLPAACVASKG